MGEQEISPEVVTGMLKIFTLDVYALLDQGATLSFVTPIVATKKIDALTDILHESFLMLLWWESRLLLKESIIIVLFH